MLAVVFLLNAWTNSFLFILFSFNVYAVLQFVYDKTQSFLLDGATACSKAPPCCANLKLISTCVCVNIMLPMYSCNVVFIVQLSWLDAILVGSKGS